MLQEIAMDKFGVHPDAYHNVVFPSRLALYLMFTDCKAAAADKECAVKSNLHRYKKKFPNWVPATDKNPHMPMAGALLSRHGNSVHCLPPHARCQSLYYGSHTSVHLALSAYLVISQIPGRPT